MIAMCTFRLSVYWLFFVRNKFAAINVYPPQVATTTQTELRQVRPAMIAMMSNHLSKKKGLKGWGSVIIHIELQVLVVIVTFMFILF